MCKNKWSEIILKEKKMTNDNREVRVLKLHSDVLTLIQFIAARNEGINFFSKN